MHLFDRSSGAELAELIGHENEVLDVVFRHDGQLASACGVRHGAVSVIRAKRIQQAVLRGPKVDVHRVVFSSDDTLLASASADKTVRLWELATGQCKAELPHASIVYGLAFSSDGKRLATGCADKTIHLWSLATQQEVAELTGHTAYVHALDFSPDGTRLVSGSGDFTLRIWTRCRHGSGRSADGCKVVNNGRLLRRRPRTASQVANDSGGQAGLQ